MSWTVIQRRVAGMDRGKSRISILRSYMFLSSSRLLQVEVAAGLDMYDRPLHVHHSVQQALSCERQGTFSLIHSVCMHCQYRCCEAHQHAGAPSRSNEICRCHQGCVVLVAYLVTNFTASRQSATVAKRCQASIAMKTDLCIAGHAVQ